MSSSSSSSCSLKRILVTGGNKGIGLAICERLLTEWSDTYVLLGSRSSERGQKAVQDLQSKFPACEGRLQFVEIDTASDESVSRAAQTLTPLAPLYGIINNAGIGWGFSVQETVNTNYFGPRRVNESIGKLLLRPGGRIVNVASASGPNFLSNDLKNNEDLKIKLYKPWVIPGGIAELDEMARNAETVFQTSNGYGVSKALLNAYTVLHAKSSQKEGLIINSCTPGWILTDLTRGSGATNPPSKGADTPCKLMMEKSFDEVPSGRYYGSDGLRSPLHFYRGPGEDPYEDDEDLQTN